MKRTVLSWLILAPVLLAGCGSGGGVAFREALLCYRTPRRKHAEEPLYIGLLNRTHPRYVKEGIVRDDIPQGIKPVSEETIGETLQRLADLGFPETWRVASGLDAALAMRPGNHVLLAEVDGETRVMVRGSAGDDAEAMRRLRRFVDSKIVIVNASRSETGFRVIQNREGASLFEKQKKDLGNRPSDGGK